MRENKGVYVTKRDIKQNLHREYLLYTNKVVRDTEEARYEKETKHNVGCQFDSKRDNILCTCRNLTPRHKETRYFSTTSRQIFRYHGSKSFTDIGVGSVKAYQRKKVRKIYLPETDDRGVGSTDLSTFISRRIKNSKGNSFYDQKKTSSKCVGEVIRYSCDVMNAKLSPIVHIRSETTNTDEIPVTLTEEKKFQIELHRTEIGNNTVETKLVTATTQVEVTDEKISVGTKPEISAAIVNITSRKNISENSKDTTKIEYNLYKEMTIVQTPEKIISPSKTLREMKEVEKKFSSDSLVEHVHNLEIPSDVKQSRLCIDPMENKLEREYRKLFSTKSKDHKSSEEKLTDDFKSTSLLKRRFEALRRSLAKRDDSKKNAVIAIEGSQIADIPSKKDVSIASDPPSLEGRSYSNTKIYSPYSSNYKQQNMSKPRHSYQKKRDSIDEDEAERQGVKGMFKLWGRKFNLEEDGPNNNCTPDTYNKNNYEKNKDVSKTDIKCDDKKEGKKFLFFKKKSKEKAKESFKPKKGVTAGRCEVRDGLTINFGGNNICTPKPSKKCVKIKDDSEELLRKAWLKKFMSNTVESRDSVKVRWNNSMYATSSSTILEIMDHIYKQTGVVITSRSEMTSSYRSDETSYISSERHVNFLQQDIEAWMIPKTIPDRTIFLPLARKNSQNQDNKNNTRVRISDHKWFIDKSKAFAHKIEVVLHSKNVSKPSKKPTSEYLRIDIPKDFFSDMSSDEARFEKPSDEEVYKIIEYETPDSTTDVKNKEIARGDTGDHLQNDTNVTISLKDSKDFESNILETVIKRPPLHRDVVVQGSNVYIPKRCDVIGVGIITQRDIRKIRKPILKIREDLITSDDSEELNLKSNSKKCAFAESFLHDYYRHWVPLGTDLYSSYVSDSHLQCCSENNSHTSFNNQGDGSKSCPNIYDDYQTSVAASSCEGSFHCITPEPRHKNNFIAKFMNKSKAEKPLTKSLEDGVRRVLPKDSLEVFKRRKVYAMSNKSNWNSHESGGDRPYSVPSIEDKEAQNSEGPKLMLSRKYTKRVLLQDKNDTPNGQALPQEPESILMYKGASGCELCKKKGSACSNHAKKAKVEPVVVEEIKEPECKESCKKSKKPACSKPNSPSCYRQQTPPNKEPNSSQQQPPSSPAKSNHSKSPAKSSHSKSPSKSPNRSQIPQKGSSKPLCNLKPLPFPPIPNSKPSKSPSPAKSPPSKIPNSPPNFPNCPPCHSSSPQNNPKTSDLSLCSTTTVIKQKSPQKQSHLSPPKKCSPSSKSSAKSTPPKSPIKSSPPKSPTKCTPKVSQKTPPKLCPPTNLSACTSQDCKNSVCKKEAKKNKEAKTKNEEKKNKPSHCDVPPCKNIPPTPPPPPPPAPQPCSPDCSPKTPCQACTSPPWKRAPPCVPCSEQNSKVTTQPIKNVTSNQPSHKNCMAPVLKDVNNHDCQNSCCKPQNIDNCEPEQFESESLTTKNKNRERQCKPDCANQKKIQELFDNKNKPEEILSDTCPPTGITSTKNICPKTCKTKPRYNGIKLVKIPSRKICSDDCLAWGNQNPDEYEQGIIRLNSKEKISIRMKKDTPSTEEIRGGMNFKIQDEDGRTLLERTNYKGKGHCYKPERKPSLLGDMYKESNVRTVSTPMSVKTTEKNKDTFKKKSDDVSIANLVEINFTLKVTQGDKTTEINIAKDDKNKGNKNKVTEKTTQQIYAVKEQDGGHTVENSNPNKNDVNIKIVIKNFKQKSDKKLTETSEYQNIMLTQELQEDFSRKISDKFHTVSTGYSNDLVDDTENVFPVHRAMIDLKSSIEKTDVINKNSVELLNQQLTGTKPINLILSSKSNILLSSTEQTVMEKTERNIEEKYSSKLIHNDNKNEIESELEEKSANHISVTNTVISNFDNEVKSEIAYKSSNFAEKNGNNVNFGETADRLPSFITGMTLSDMENSQSDENYDLTNKPRNLAEKKEMLKKIFKSASHLSKSENKERMSQLRGMLKVILTSDSSEQEEMSIRSKNVLKDVASESMKPNLFRDSDNISSYNNPDGEDRDSMIKSENITFSSIDNSGPSMVMSIEDTPKPQGCLCRLLATKLNMCQAGVNGCCCKMSNKRSEETYCDLRTEDDLSLLNFKTEYVSVETQNSRLMRSELNSVNVSIDSATRSDFNTFQTNAISQQRTLSVEFKQTVSITGEVIAKQNSTNSNEKALNLSEENEIQITSDTSKLTEQDRIIEEMQDIKTKEMKEKYSTRLTDKLRSKWKRKEKVLDSVGPVDILQCYKTKKAVLEIYTEKTYSEHGEHLVAKLPKFLFDRDSDLERNYEEIIENSCCKER